MKGHEKTQIPFVSHTFSLPMHICNSIINITNFQQLERVHGIEMNQLLCLQEVLNLIHGIASDLTWYKAAWCGPVSLMSVMLALHHYLIWVWWGGEVGPRNMATWNAHSHSYAKHPWCLFINLLVVFKSSFLNGLGLGIAHCSTILIPAYFHSTLYLYSWIYLFTLFTSFSPFFLISGDLKWLLFFSPPFFLPYDVS